MWLQLQALAFIGKSLEQCAAACLFLGPFFFVLFFCVFLELEQHLHVINQGRMDAAGGDKTPFQTSQPVQTTGGGSGPIAASMAMACSCRDYVICYLWPVSSVLLFFVVLRTFCGFDAESSVEAAFVGRIVHASHSTFAGAGCYCQK